MGECFLEQANPGKATAKRLLVQQFFLLVRQLMGPERPQIANPWPIARRLFILQQIGQKVFVQAVDLKGEKQDHAGYIGHPFLNALIKTPGFGISGISGKDKLGVAYRLVHSLGNALVGNYCSGQARAVQFRQSPLVTIRKIIGIGCGAVQVVFQLRRIRATIKIVEIPYGKIA